MICRCVRLGGDATLSLSRTPVPSPTPRCREGMPPPFLAGPLDMVIGTQVVGHCQKPGASPSTLRVFQTTREALLRGNREPPMLCCCDSCTQVERPEEGAFLVPCMFPASARTPHPSRLRYRWLEEGRMGKGSAFVFSCCLEDRGLSSGQCAIRSLREDYSLAYGAAVSLQLEGW